MLNQSFPSSRLWQFPQCHYMVKCFLSVWLWQQWSNFSLPYDNNNSWDAKGKVGWYSSCRQNCNQQVGVKTANGGFPGGAVLRICLPMQETQVRALVWEDPTCRGAPGPVSHNYWACASGACAPQRERPRQWEARAPRWRVAPACRKWRKPSHRNEDPTQPKINK